MSSVLGIFGGTFDPIHCGHLELARELREALALSKVRLIPAGDPPHRSAPAVSAAHRLKMVELAVANHPALEVDAREIAREGRSYTVTTLEELREEDGGRTLALIVGGDAFLGLATWHRWREVFDLAHLVVVARPGVALSGRLPAELEREWRRRRCDDTSVIFSQTSGAIIEPRITAHPISASAIRKSLARGSDGIVAVRALLPPAVLAYIERNRLYLSPQDAT